jgi:Uma2 family endonuclease
VSTAQPPAVKPLIAGQQLNRAEFHERYLATPPGFRAELIGGIVVVPSPVGNRHDEVHRGAVLWTGFYESRTPGIKGGLEGSTALDEISEVQPDTCLRIKPEHGGQTYKLGNIIGGCPELVIEVASSSRAIDLGPKLADYERAGALEYVVLAVNPDEVYWHVRDGDRLVRVPPDPDGLYRSRVFRGLWLDPAALFAYDLPAILATVDRGLASPEHAEFVARLAAAGGDPAKPRP